MPAIQDAPSYAPLYITYGRMRMTGYFRHRLDGYVGGQKVVVQTDRGIEMGELNVSHCATCPAAVNCHNPENTDRRDKRGGVVGRVLRAAGPDDVLETEKLREQDREIRDAVRVHSDKRKIPMRVVDAERLLGGDRIVIYFSSELRIDFRDLVKDLAHEYQTRIEMRQIGAREEAKLLGEGYGRCGQVLCCQSFLKDLAPVPMRMAKTQKGTLDPGKVSGRCGRLMCCLRYENETYEELRRKLPRSGTRVKTPQGDGEVVDGQILTQLVLVDIPGKGRVPLGVEEITWEAPPPQAPGKGRGDRRDDRRDRGDRPAEARHEGQEHHDEHSDEHHDEHDEHDHRPEGDGGEPPARPTDRGPAPERDGSRKEPGKPERDPPPPAGEAEGGFEV